MHRMSWTVLCSLMLCHFSALILFMVSLWPMKVFLTGYGNLSNLPPEPCDIYKANASRQRPYEPVFERLVIMVVDALRDDFVIGENFPRLNELLENNLAVKFKAKAHPPTVTLPKIKAITSGSLSSYTDVLLNFNAESFLQDNIVHQAYQLNKKILFFGDETWIRLFPHHFARSDGTTSFFVQDFVEVDDNVTRHLDKELSAVDWDVLILHYLGLDHIGHVHGPSNSLVRLKLHEMDGVVRKIFTALQEIDQNSILPSLFVICGDHGMSDYGSHGGASETETTIPLIFITSKKFDVHSNDLAEINQVDQSSLAPTLSILLGLPIPINNIGVVLHPLLSFLNPRERLYALFMNLYQMMQLVNATSSGYTKDYFNDRYKHTINLHAQTCTYSTLNEKNVEVVCQVYLEVLNEMSYSLMSNATDQDIYAMVVAVILLWQVLLFLVGKIFFEENVFRKRSFMQLLLLCCIVSLMHWSACVEFGVNSKMLCSSKWINVVVSSGAIVSVSWLFINAKFSWCISLQEIRSSTILVTSAWMLHSVSLFATSFIEEEHQTWYFVTCSFHQVLSAKILRSALFKSKLNREHGIKGVSAKASAQIGENKKVAGIDQSDQKNETESSRIQAIVICLFIIRICRSWNQTGDKWAHLTDIKFWLNKEENSLYMNASVLLSLCILFYLNFHQHLFVKKCLFFVSSSAIFIHHCIIQPEDVLRLTIARCVFTFVLLLLMQALYHVNETENDNVQSVKNIISGWLLLSSLLIRKHNVLLLGLFVLHEHLLSKFLRCLTPQEMTAVYYCLGLTSYFYMGNSNNLARIDVAAGYVGQSGYNPVISGLLIWCHTYAGPVFWMLSLLLQVLKAQKLSDSVGRETCCILLLARCLPCAAFVVSVTLQRSHLFIWSVFSPKLLFEGMHSVFVCLVIGIIVLMTRKKIK